MMQIVFTINEQLLEQVKNTWMFVGIDASSVRPFDIKCNKTVVNVLLSEVSYFVFGCEDGEELVYYSDNQYIYTLPDGPELYLNIPQNINKKYIQVLMNKKYGKELIKCEYVNV